MHPPAPLSALLAKLQRVLKPQKGPSRPSSSSSSSTSTSSSSSSSPQPPCPSGPKTGPRKEGPLPLSASASLVSFSSASLSRPSPSASPSPSLPSLPSPCHSLSAPCLSARPTSPPASPPAIASAPALPLPPFSLDQFRMKRTVGTGSYGRVMVAEHRPSGVYVALKILSKERVVRKKQVEHCRNERDLLEELPSRFAVRLLGSFQDAKNLYLVMEYMRGGELFQLLRAGRRLLPEAVRFYTSQVVLALEDLHSRDIIYRDLKPENLLLTDGGYLRLTDFGFAKRIQGKTWTICGTPEYASPEVLSGRGAGKGVDIWALGVILYELLTGHSPFYARDLERLDHKILAGKVSYPDILSPEARDLISSLLQQDPAHRPSLAQIKLHPFYAGLDWVAMREERVPAPYLPKPKRAEGDTSCFALYPEDPHAFPSPGETDPYEDLFRDW